MNLATNLATATAGQTVIWHPPSSYSPAELHPITHATATKLVVNELEYNRKGFLRGRTGYLNSHISTADSLEYALKVQAAWVRHRRIERFKGVTWEKLTDEQLAAVAAILKPKEATP